MTLPPLFRFLPVALAAAAFSASPVSGGESGEETGAPGWPGWRGPAGDGVSPETGLPVRFAAGETLAFRTPVPGRGHSSPAVREGRVFLSAAVAGEPVPGHAPADHVRGGEVYLHPASEAGERRHTLFALAYDAATGEELWRRTAYEGPVFDNRHRGNTYASPTPAVDEERAYFWFGSEGLYAYTLDGEPVWERDLGDFGVWGLGHGISPVLHGELLILVCDDDDAGEHGALVAVDRRSGATVWKTPRRVRKSWATPTLVPVGGALQLVISSFDRIAGYAPDTGLELWATEGFGSNAIHTPLSFPLDDAAGGGRLVFASTGYPKKEMRAIRLTPDLSPERPPETAWSYRRGTGYLPSALLYGGLLFIVSDGGVVTALEPETAEVAFLGRPTKPGRYHASPVGYEGLVLIASIEGDLTVFRADRAFEIVAESSLADSFWASPAIADGTVFLRGASALYGFRVGAAASPTGPPGSPAR